MRRSCKFLLSPTRRQQIALAACLEDHRQLYNAALEHRRTAYRMAGATVRYGDQSADLKHIRADDPAGQGRWSFSSQQTTLRRLDKAGDGCRWDSQPEHASATFVRLQGVGHVRVHQHRRVLGRVKTIGIERQGARWYVVLSCDGVPARPLPAAGRGAGIDVGVVSLATTGDGQHLVDPRRPTASADRLAAAQRDLARKELRSKRRRKAAARIAASHAKVRRRRPDSAHKAESAGRRLIAVNPADTSRTCAHCGPVAKENRVTQAEFRCRLCGHTAHADVNAATNILRAGLALRDAAGAA